MHFPEKLEAYENKRLFCACRKIHEDLTIIAEQTRTMAVAECANPSNPLFLMVMDQQDDLLRQLQTLDQKMAQ